jgi:8-amino-7-oxononanoate synthase
MKTTFAETLARLDADGRLRTLCPITSRDGCRVVRRGREMLNLSSNDYLGLAGSKELHRLFYAGMDLDKLLDCYGLGAASSRLLSGDCRPLHALEEALTESYGFAAALFYNSGYHANIGILPALFGKGDLILSDKLNHASIHDGIRLTRAEHKRFRHGDYPHLTSLLEKNRQFFDRVVIASESVFSMDGDVADLVELARLKEKFDCLLYIDEAHALGVYGDRGLGMAQEKGVLASIDLLVGPFGKACASIGSFVLCSEEIRSYLINHSRSLIFTTALPPVIASWNLLVFSRMLGMAKERRHLQGLAGRLRQSLADHGLKTAGTTQIVPVVIGDNRRTVLAAEKMQEAGYLVLAVRPPTVPEGTARFRLSLTADMQWPDLAPLAPAIARCLRSL